jgi:hypothetical protein
MSWEKAVNNKFFIAFCFLLTGCWMHPPPSPEFFYASTFARWPFAVEITTPRTAENRPETGAVMTWELLAQIKMIGPEGKKAVKDCLFYRTPFAPSKYLGILKIVFANAQGECQGLEKGQELIGLQDIEDLQMEISGESPSKKSNLATHTLKLQIKIKNKESLVWEYPLYNLKKNHLFWGDQNKSPRSVHKLQKYSSSATVRKKEGMMFWPPGLRGPELDEETSLWGEKTNNFLEGTLVNCYEVDEKCQLVGEYNCDRCRYGWFEVVGKRRCPSGGPKFCRPNRCGERGWPACLRGYEFSGLSTLPTCFDGSVAGFCQEGFTTYCQNGILVCL